MAELTIPSPIDLFKEIPFPESGQAKIKHFRDTIKKILVREDPRLLLVIGPCSIHDLESTYDYASRFLKLAQETSDQFFLVMRTYFEKPRTVLGWKGFLNDPFLDGSCDIVSGLRFARKLLVDLVDMGIPAGSELLEIQTAPYFSDLLSWGCIGARTSMSQPHRQLAASLDFPIGFKNTPDGNVENAIHGILSAATPHHFLGMLPSGKMARLSAKGNPNCHVVLRGGHKSPNYDSRSIQEAIHHCTSAGITEKIIVDCSHDNCRKMHQEQVRVFQTIIQEVVEGCNEVAGVMLESHLYEGSQLLGSNLRYGVSITDPCLSWQETEHLVHSAYEKLTKVKYEPLFCS